MARKQKDNPLKDLAEIVSHLPWWVALILAALSFVLLHTLAKPPTTTNVKPNDILGLVLPGLVTGVAMVGQYVLPGIFCFGAAWSIWRRRHRRALFTGVASGTAADRLDKLTWPEFEHLVGEAFRLDGFAVEERGGAAPDGGVDLVLRRGGEKFLVQCKQWRAYKVGVAIVRELYGVMAASGATGGFVVTSGTFTEDAIAFANGRNVVLVDGRVLLDMIERAERVPTGRRG